MGAWLFAKPTFMPPTTGALHPRGRGLLKLCRGIVGGRAHARVYIFLASPDGQRSQGPEEQGIPVSTTSGLLRDDYELLMSLADALSVPGLLWSKDLWASGYVPVSVLDKELQHGRISSPPASAAHSCCLQPPPPTPITGDGEECVWLVAGQQ